jgi:hypothetical protein
MTMTERNEVTAELADGFATILIPVAGTTLCAGARIPLDSDDKTVLRLFRAFAAAAEQARIDRAREKVEHRSALTGAALGV